MKKCLFAIVLFVGCADNSSVHTNHSNVNTSNSEYNYAKNRMKLEGYSDKDSATAAKAITKFQEAQRNRR